jgi:hypothetical protein
MAGISDSTRSPPWARKISFIAAAAIMVGSLDLAMASTTPLNSPISSASIAS